MPAFVLGDLLMEAFFFFCLAMTTYPYALYPLLVSAWSRVGGRMWSRGKYKPMISLIISVHNEEKIIRDKIENALALDYPEDLLEILVVSDGSTDNTNSIASSFQDKRIILKAYERSGKTACLNRAAADARGDILVFTDANSIFPPDTLNKIVRNFSDEKVGLVSGWTRYRTQGSQKEEATGFYARLEKFIKESESTISSCVGADGAIFAMRRELYRPLEDQDINDFVIPLNVVDQNRRVVMDPNVYCFEEPSEGIGKEYSRQVRITNRTLGAIYRNMRFLNPLRFGSFSFFLFSHKILRFMVPFFAGGLLLSSILLVSSAGFYLLVLTGMTLFILTGVAGLLKLFNLRLVNLCTAFLLTNMAQIVGWARFLTGRADTLWTPQRY